MDTMLTLECPRCGGKLAFSPFSKIAHCEYCGQESISNELVSRQSACPICLEKDQVQRVSAIMQSDDPIAQHLRPPEKPKIPTYAQFCVDKGVVDLKEPKRDFKKKDLKYYLISALILLFFAVSLFSDPAESGNIVLGVLLIILSILLIYLAYRANQFNRTEVAHKEEEFQQKLKDFLTEKEAYESDLHDEYEALAKSMWDKWNLAMKRWEMLYYCRRDHIIYVPGSGRYEEVKNIIKYLYS